MVNDSQKIRNREYAKKYRATHKEKIRKDVAIWQKLHPEVRKRWLMKNKEKLKGYQNSWIFKNKERWREYQRSYQKKRREEFKWMKARLALLEGKDVV